MFPHGDIEQVRHGGTAGAGAARIACRRSRRHPIGQSRVRPALCGARLRRQRAGRTWWRSTGSPWRAAGW